MAMKRWLGVAMVFALSATVPIRAAQLGAWAPRFFTGAEIDICTDSTDCARNFMYVNLNTLEELDTVGARITSVADFSNSDAFTYNDSFTVTNGNVISTGQRFIAAIPNDGVSAPYNLPAWPSDPVFSCNVSRIVPGTQTTFNSFDMSPPTNSVKMEFSVENWTFANPMFTLNMTLAIVLNENSTQPSEMPMIQYIAVGVHRYQLSQTVYFDLPQVAFDATGAQVPAYASITKSSGSYSLNLGFASNSFIKYAFLMNAEDPVAFATPAPSRSPTPAPTPAPTPEVEVKLPTTVNVLPGGFEFCAAANCNNKDGSVSMMLDRFGYGASVDVDKNVVFSTVLTNFTASAKELKFVTPDVNATLLDRNKHKTLFVSIPKTSGRATRANESSFSNATDSEAIYMALSIEHLAKASNGSESTSFDNISIPIGGVRLVIAVSIPTSMVKPFNMASPALSFLIAAFEKGTVVANVTVEQDMYSTTVLLGDSMRLEFLAFADVDGSATPMTVIAKPHTFGKYEGLIELTLLASSITSPSNFFFGASISTAVLDSGATSATNTTTWSIATPSVVPGFEGVKTQILALSHGEFGLCLDSTSCGKSSVKMGFSGLGSTGSSGDSELGRFANAQAFEFSEPALVSEIVNGTNVTKWSTGFRALVPQSQFRPPMPYDPNAPPSQLPEFAVQVDQYLTPGASSNGDQQISVPSGGLKFAFNLTKWKFDSPTDSLVLNITLANATGTGVPGDAIPSAFQEIKDVAMGLSRTTVNVSSSLATIAEFPLFAVIDGVMTAIDIAAIFDPSIGVVVSMKFPYFADTLFYDPVLSSSLVSDPSSTPVPTPSLSPTRGADMNLRKKHSNSAMSTELGRTAMILLAFLGFVAVLTIMRCAKRVSFKGLNLSKVIP